MFRMDNLCFGMDLFYLLKIIVEDFHSHKNENK